MPALPPYVDRGELPPRFVRWLAELRAAYAALRPDANALLPAPTLTGLSATQLLVGSNAFDLVASGTLFIPGRTVLQWNGASRKTTWLSEGSLSASIPASDLAAAGTFPVTAFTPPPGGGESAPRAVIVGDTQPATWADLGNANNDIDGNNTKLFGGGSPTTSSNSGSVPVDFQDFATIRTTYSRTYSGSWFDDDFTDSSFKSIFFLNTVRGDLGFPGSSWVYNDPARDNQNWPLIVFRHRRTHTLAPHVLFQPFGIPGVAQAMELVNAGSETDDGPVLVEEQIAQLSSTQFAASVLINGVHRWHADVTVQNWLGHATPGTGCWAMHFHRYQSGSAYVYVQDGKIAVT